MKLITKFFALIAASTMLTACNLGGNSQNPFNPLSQESNASLSNGTSVSGESLPNSNPGGTQESNSTLNNSSNSNSSSARSSSRVSSSKASSIASSVTSSISSSNGGSTENWYDAFLQDGINYSPTLPESPLTSLLATANYDLSWIDVSEGCLYIVNPETDEDFGSVMLLVNGDQTDDMLDAAFDLDYRIVEDMFDVYVVDTNANYVAFIYPLYETEESETPIATEIDIYAGIDLFTFDLTTDTTWNADVVSVFNDYLGGNSIPFMKFGADYMADVTEYDGMDYVLINDFYYDDLIDEYYDVLEENGYEYVEFDLETFEGDYLVKDFSNGDEIVISCYWDYYGNNIVIEYYPDETSGGGDIGPVGTPNTPVTITLNGASENYIISQNDEKVVWNFGAFTLTVEKNTATLGVGGDSALYLSNPLRLYKGHKITITWNTPDVPKTFVLNGNSDSKSKISAISSGVTGATATLNGRQLTYTVSSDATSVSVVSTDQVRLDSIVATW